MDNYETTDASMGVSEDPLHQVLALERRAEGIVRDAEAEAVRITTTADERIAEISARASQDIDRQIQEIQSSSDKTVQSRAAEIAAEADQSWHDWQSQANANVTSAARFVVDVVLAGAKA